MKILTIVGARPQFVKAAMISKAIRDYNTHERNYLNEVILHTGQHFDWKMSNVFFEELNIPSPAYNLGINSQSHGSMTGRMIENIEVVLMAEKPDWVLVFGDTNSTLAGTIAAKKLHLRIGHVEAGLRSYNIRMPEEQNRIVTDRLSNILFCPTSRAVKNLKEEGIGNSRYGETVVNVGDVMYDALKIFSIKGEKKLSILSELQIQPEKYVLSTIHRAENTESSENLENIINALRQISNDIVVVFPAHPKTSKIIRDSKIEIGKIKMIDPVSYLDMIVLEKNCLSIITDSGGIQKEAYYFKKACITLRNETEWNELVDAGVNFLAGTKMSSIVKSFKTSITKQIDFSQKFYGNGNAGKKIVTKIANST